MSLSTNKLSKGQRLGVMILGLVIAAIIALIWFLILHKPQLNNHKSAATVVSTSKAKVADVPIMVDALGTLSALQTTNVSSQIDGTIEKILFHEGQTVQQNQILFILNHDALAETYKAAEAKSHYAEWQYQAALKIPEKEMSTANLKQLKSAANSAKADAQLAWTNLHNSIIRAAFSGTIASTSYHPGDYINAGTTLTTLVNNNYLKLSYQLPKQYQANLKIGSPLSFTDGAQQYHATVSYISPTVDPTTQTITLHALVDNSSKHLHAGSIVNVTQTVSTLFKQVVVPELAVIGDFDHYYVYVVSKNKAEQQNVTLGPHYQSQVVIKSGLKPNESYISLGQNLVSNGMAVKTVKSASWKYLIFVLNDPFLQPY